MNVNSSEPFPVPMEDLHWSDEKKRLFDLDDNAIVSASAGTGKTTALTELIVRWIEERPEERSLHDLVAITFTEKAAGEMKQRIREFILDRLARGRDLSLWEQVRRSLPASHIGTIHGFCARILRENAFQFDLDPEFTVLQQRDASRHFSRIVNEHVADSVRQGEPGARELLRNFGFQEEGSSSHDLQGVMETLLNQCRSHGIKPENVRTRMESFIQKMPDFIERRVDRCVEAINRIVEIPDDDSTKTGERLREFRPVADRLKEWLNGIDRNTEMVEFTEWRRRATSILKGNVTKELSDAREPLRNYLGFPSKRPDPSSRGELQKMVALLKAEPLHDALLDHLIRINDTYRSFKREEGYLDFDDLLFAVRDGLRDDLSLRERYKSSFDLLLIDEFQDVNRLQYELLFYLSERSGHSAEVSGEEPFERIQLEPGKFVVVGDPKQSIYMFRGADVSLFQQTLSDLTDRGGDSFRFRENFRSVPGLIRFFNSFSTFIFEHDGEDAEDFYVSYGERDDLVAVRDEPDGEPSPRVELLSPPETSGPSDQMRELEAKTIVERIRQFTRDGTPVRVEGENGERRSPDPGEIAVLFRSTSHLHHYERAFRERDIPHQLFKGQDFFKTPEIRDMTELFSFLAYPDREVHLLSYLKSPMVGVIDDTLVTLKSVAQSHYDGRILDAFWSTGTEPFPDGEGPKIDRARDQLRQLLNLRDRLSPAELVRHVRDKTDLDAVLLNGSRGRQAVANLDKLVSLLSGRDSGSMRFSEAARYLSRSVRKGAVEEEAPVSGTGDEKVQLMTVHSAKGLEFPVVVIADMGSVKPRVHSPHLFDPDKGIGIRWRDPETDIPHRTWSYHRIRERRKKKEQAESRRLLYVAMTRARDYLVLSGWYPVGGWGRPRKKGTWWEIVEELYGAGTDETLPDVFDSLDGTAVRSLSCGDESTPVRLCRFPSFDESGADSPASADGSSSDGTYVEIDPESGADDLGIPYEGPEQRRLRFTATELLELLKCPRRYAFLTEHSIPEDIGEEEVLPRESTERHSWKQAGTLAHGLLEHLEGPDVPSAERVSKIAERRRSGQFLDPDIRREVIDRVRNGYGKVYERYLRNADVVRKERSFAYRSNVSRQLRAVIEGTVDLYARRGDERLILDYKYAHRRAEKVRDDRLQLLLYALPYLESREMEPESLTCVIFYLREDADEGLYEMTPGLEELEQFRERTADAIRTAAEMEESLPLEWEGENERGPCEDRRCGFIPFCWEDG